jgi:hypothetical protein
MVMHCSVPVFARRPWATDPNPHTVCLRLERAQNAECGALAMGSCDTPTACCCSGALVQVLALPLTGVLDWVTDPSLAKSPGALFGVMWGCELRTGMICDVELHIGHDGWLAVARSGVTCCKRCKALRSRRAFPCALGRWPMALLLHRKTVMCQSLTVFHQSVTVLRGVPSQTRCPLQVPHANERAAWEHNWS